MSTAKQRREIYVTPRWRQVREVVLSRSGYLCVECLASGHTTGAEEVHHVKPVWARPDLALNRTIAVRCAVNATARRIARTTLPAQSGRITFNHYLR